MEQALCRMFHRAIRGHGLPKYLSSDHDPLYRFHQWEANLQILELTEIKTVHRTQGLYHRVLVAPIYRNITNFAARLWLMMRTRSSRAIRVSGSGAM